MLRPYTNADPAQFDHMGPDFDLELFQQHLADRAAGDPRHRLARARPLQDVPRVLAVVLERAGEIGVPGARARDLAAPLGTPSSTGGVGLGRHHLLPVLPIPAPDEHRDGGAKGLAGAHPREPLDLVGFDLHAGAAAVAAHPPLQLRVDALGGQGEPRGNPLEHRHQAPSMRLARRREPKHQRVLMPPDNSTRARLWAGLSRSSGAPPEVRSHRRDGACGLMFVIGGSETTTSPRAVIPNRYCWPVDTSSATRNGPMIGSRIAIFFCWLKK